MAPTYYNATDTALVVDDSTGAAAPPRTRYTGTTTPAIDRHVAAGLLVEVADAPKAATKATKTDKE